MPDYRQQIRQLEDMRRVLQRDINNLKQSVRSLDRRKGDLRRVPGSDRERANVDQQIRQGNKDVERRRQELRTIERQIADLKRLQR